jgi:hypothetical protein
VGAFHGVRWAFDLAGASNHRQLQGVAESHIADLNDGKRLIGHGAILHSRPRKPSAAKALSYRGPARKGTDGFRKHFFFEKKKQKTFYSLKSLADTCEFQESKVFWFFFSKKNDLTERKRRWRWL